MAKDFRAAFNNMNQAVRPGVGESQQVPAPAAPVVKEKKMRRLRGERSCMVFRPT